jgi:hypothetical protein
VGVGTSGSVTGVVVGDCGFSSKAIVVAVAVVGATVRGAVVACEDCETCSASISLSLLESLLFAPTTRTPTKTTAIIRVTSRSSPTTRFFLFCPPQHHTGVAGGGLDFVVVHSVVSPGGTTISSPEGTILFTSGASVSVVSVQGGSVTAPEGNVEPCCVVVDSWFSKAGGSAGMAANRASSAKAGDSSNVGGDSSVLAEGSGGIGGAGRGVSSSARVLVPSSSEAVSSAGGSSDETGGSTMTVAGVSSNSSCSGHIRHPSSKPQPGGTGGSSFVIEGVSSSSTNNSGPAPPPSVVDAGCSASFLEDAVLLTSTSSSSSSLRIVASTLDMMIERVWKRWRRGANPFCFCFCLYVCHCWLIWIGL